MRIEKEAAPRVASRLGGQALYVFGGNLFTLAVGLPLQIYVSRQLGAGGLGIYSLLEGAAATGAGFLGLGLAQTAVRFIPQYLEEGDYRAIRALVVNGALALLLLGTAGYLAALAVWTTLGRTIFTAPFGAVALMGALLPLSLLVYFLQQCLRGFQEIRYLVFGSSFLQLSVKVAVTIIAFGLGARLVGYALATVIASFAALAWMAFGLLGKLRRIAKLQSGKRSDGPWKRYALISFSTSVLSLPASYLDRFLLGYFAGVGPVGVLAVTRQLQQLPLVLYQMLLSVAAPMFAAAHARNARAEQEHLYALTTDWAVRLSLPLVMFFWLFTRPTLALFGKSFADEGALALQVFMAAQFLNLVTGPNGNLANMSGLEREAFRIDIVTTIATALLLLALVPFLGLLGVALAVLANSFANNVWTLAMVRHRLGIRWWDSRYFGWLLPAAATGAIGLLLSTYLNVSGAIPLACCVLAMYLAFGMTNLVQGLHTDDRELISLVLARLRSVASVRRATKRSDAQ